MLVRRLLNLNFWIPVCVPKKRVVTHRTPHLQTATCWFGVRMVDCSSSIVDRAVRLRLLTSPQRKFHLASGLNILL